MGKNRKKDQPKSQRYKIEGRRTTAQLRRMLHDVVDDLEARGITEVMNSNLYVSLPPSEDTDNLDVITLSDPYECAADEYDA